MSRAKRLDIIRSVAMSEEVEERKTMATSEQQYEVAAERLDELKSFRSHYATSKRPSCGSSALQWQDFHNFLSRLDKAVSEQEKIVDEGRVQREAHRNRWLVKRRRLESLSRAIDRFTSEERDSEERRQQRQLDAISTRRSTH